MFVPQPHAFVFSGYGAADVSELLASSLGLGQMMRVVVVHADIAGLPSAHSQSPYSNAGQNRRSISARSCATSNALSRVSAC